MAQGIDPVLAYVLDDLVALAPFGLSVELRLMVGATLVVGAPISDADYFADLGAQFRKSADELSSLVWNGSYEVRQALRQGWSQQQLTRLSDDRDFAFQRFGTYVQDQLGQHV